MIYIVAFNTAERAYLRALVAEDIERSGRSPLADAIETRSRSSVR